MSRTEQDLTRRARIILGAVIALWLALLLFSCAIVFAGRVPA